MRNPISRKGAKARRRRHLFLKDHQPEDPNAKALPALGIDLAIAAPGITLAEIF
jgi:hypothetical protein